MDLLDQDEDLGDAVDDDEDSCNLVTISGALGPPASHWECRPEIEEAPGRDEKSPPKFGRRNQDVFLCLQ